MGATPRTLEAGTCSPQLRTWPLTFSMALPAQCAGLVRCTGCSGGSGGPTEGVEAVPVCGGEGACPLPPPPLSQGPSQTGLAPHRAPCIPLAFEHHLSCWHNSLCVPAAGAQCRSSAQDSGCLQELCQRNRQHKDGRLQGGGWGDTGLETSTCTLGLQRRGLGWSPDPRALSLMHQQEEKW